MRFIIVTGWAGVVLLIYESRFPLDVSGALGATADGFRHLYGTLPGALVAIPLSWVRLAWGIAVFSVSQAAAFSVGSVFCGWLAPGLGLTGRRRWLSTVVIGWLGCGLGLLGLALAGLFDRVVLGFATVLLLAHFLLPRPVHSVRVWMLTRDYWAALFPPGRDWLARAAFLITLVSLAGCAVCLLAPQTGSESLSRHLAISARTVQLGRLASLPGNFFFDLPCMTELLRGWALALGGEPAARLWMLGALASGAAAMFAVVEPLSGVRWAWIGCAAWVSSPFAVGLALDGSAGLFLAPVLLAAVAVLGRSITRKPMALLAGLMGGMALGCDLLASAWPLAILLIVLFLNRDRRMNPVAGAVFLAAGVALAAGPWLMRSWLLWCDPVYPFSRGECGGMSPPAVAAYFDYLSRAGPEGAYDSVLAKYVAPWTATMTDRLSPFWLAFVPFSLLAIRLGLPARLLFAAGILGMTGWLVGPPQLGLGVPALAWLMAAALAGLASHHAAERGILTALVSATLLFQVARTGVDLAASGSVLAGLGIESSRSYFQRTLPVYSEMLDQVRGEIPLRARVLLVGETRAYPAFRRTLVTSAHEPFAAYGRIRASGSVEALERRLRQLGVEYVVHNHPASFATRPLKAASAWEAGDIAAWAGFWSLHARLPSLPKILDASDGYYIYRLTRERDRPLATPTLPGIEEAFSSIEADRKRGRLREASRMVGVLNGLAGDFPAVKYLIGTEWYGGDSYRAYSLLKNADTGGLRNLDLWHELARRAEARWQVEEALMYEEKIARFNPRVSTDNRRRLIVRLVTRALKKGQLQEAERLLRKGLRIAPDDAALWARLSDVLLGLKRRLGAEGAIRKAIELDPGNEDYRRALRLLLR